jgi:hypothetical protein
VIVPIMEMIKRRGDQSDHHRDHAKTRAKALHTVDSLVACGGKSMAHGFDERQLRFDVKVRFVAGAAEP